MDIECASITRDIVVAVLARNPTAPVALDAVKQLISEVYAAVSNLGAPSEPEKVELTPAVPVKKSVTPDYLVSLEDGRRYKSLKRHLGGRGLTPEQYRAKWRLPADYPMVAANYAKVRSDLAKSMGLGRKAA
jgi:predicted transcriptional regulator